MDRNALYLEVGSFRIYKEHENILHKLETLIQRTCTALGNGMLIVLMFSKSPVALFYTSEPLKQLINGQKCPQFLTLLLLSNETFLARISKNACSL